MRPSRPRRLAFAAIALAAAVLLADVALDLALRTGLAPAALRARIQGLPLHMRRTGPARFTRVPSIDVRYAYDPDRDGDLVAMGMTPGEPPSGDAPLEVRLRTDARGFRSLGDHDACDVVVLGDSLAEGANVPEADAFPLALDRLSGLRVCSLAVSGAAPLVDLDHLAAHGLPRRPRLVLLAWFEGNDLWDSVAYAAIREREAREHWLRRTARERPLAGLAVRAARALGGALRDPPRAAALAPLRLPPGPHAAPVAFHRAYVARLLEPAEALARSERWRLGERLLDAIRAEAALAGADLAVVYLPGKPHVYLPWLDGPETAAALARFAAPDLDGDALARALRANAGAQQALVSAWCERRGVALVDLLEPLRAAAAEGRRPFFAYDTHLSPAGHAVVTGRLLAFLAARDAAAHSSEPRSSSAASPK